jgi:hypothetical protein
MVADMPGRGPPGLLDSGQKAGCLRKADLFSSTENGRDGCSSTSCGVLWR